MVRSNEFDVLRVRKSSKDKFRMLAAKKRMKMSNLFDDLMDEFGDNEIMYFKFQKR